MVNTAKLYISEDQNHTLHNSTEQKAVLIELRAIFVRTIHVAEFGFKKVKLLDDCGLL